MRSRIVGGVALVLGLLVVVLMLMDPKPMEWKPLLGGLAFIGLGGYYLLTGRRAASMKEFVVEGKLSHDDAAPPKA
jgi:hypothetical protein